MNFEELKISKLTRDYVEEHIDYAFLLKKYMDHVVMIEGTDFLGSYMELFAPSEHMALEWLSKNEPPSPSPLRPPVGSPDELRWLRNRVIFLSAYVRQSQDDVQRLTELVKAREREIDRLYASEETL